MGWVSRRDRFIAAAEHGISNGHSQPGPPGLPDGGGVAEQVAGVPASAERVSSAGVAGPGDVPAGGGARARGENRRSSEIVAGAAGDQVAGGNATDEEGGG